MPYSYHHSREPLTPDEATRLRQACKSYEERVLIWTLLDTGLRVEEFCSLTSQSINWQTQEITIYGKNTKAKTKRYDPSTGEPIPQKRKRRLVPLTTRLAELLENYFNMKPAVPYKKRNAEYIVKRVANRAKIARPCSPHVLRHTFAIQSLQKGLSLPALQKILGHEDLSTTAIYLNLSTGQAVREYLDKMDVNGLGLNGREHLKEFRGLMER